MEKISAEQATQVFVKTNETPEQVKEIMGLATNNGVRLLVFENDEQRSIWRSRLAKLQESHYWQR